MARFVQILLVVFLLSALCSAEVPQSRLSRIQAKRNRFAARQVAVEPDAVTPYPSADELKPDVSFDEAVPAEEQQPNQPDEIYGPPENENPEEEQAVANEGEQAAVEDEYTSARLTARRRSLARSAKLRKTPSARLQLKPKVISKPVFYYVAQ